MAESALRQYEYGGDGLFGFFMPERREILSPEQRLDQGYTSTRRGPGVEQIYIPAKLGESETSLEYMPAYRAGKSALNAVISLFTDPPSLDEAKEAGTSALRGIDQYMKDQYTAGALGGRAYNPETGQVTEFDPVTPATMLAPTGFLSSAARTPGSTTLFSWGGPMSRKADQEKLFQANRMEDAGSTAEEIKNATGWQRNLDGEWMYWIPDNKSQIQSTKMRSDMLGLEASDKELASQNEMFQGIHSYFQRPLGQILKHEELYEAYPFLENMPVSYKFDGGPVRGSYSVANKDIKLNIRDEDKSRRGIVDSKSTLLHEISHAVSDMERRSAGASSSYMPQILENAEQMDIKPLQRAYVDYQDKSMEQEALFKVNEYQTLKELADSGKIKEFMQTPMFSRNSGAILNTWGDPSGPDDTEWFKTAMTLIRKMETDKMGGFKESKFMRNLDLPSKEINSKISELGDELKKLQPKVDEYQFTRNKYSTLRRLDPYDSYLLSNDEFLARTVQQLMKEKPRSTYDVPLYRQIEGDEISRGRISPDTDMDKILYNVPRYDQYD